MNKNIDELKKHKIGILAGGPSSERDISLKSGKAVLAALQGAHLDVIFLDVNEDDFSVAIDKAGIDLAFIALHGRFGEDGTVQKLLTNKNIPYTGSGPVSSHLALDKLASKEKFVAQGIKVPKHVVVCSGERAEKIDIGFPCVVKPRYEGSSMGLSVVKSENELEKALKKAAEFGDETIVEEYISGREVTVGVLDNKPLPVVEIVAAGGVYDFRAKYDSRETEYIVPAKIEPEYFELAQKIALRAHEALGCTGFSRVDMRLSEEGEVYVLEVNTIPGLTERSLLPMAAGAAGMDFSQLCISMLEGALRKRGDK